jgi:hypothetical protein
VAAAQAQRSLAAQLAGAQAQAEELAGRWRVSDLALNNEVGEGVLEKGGAGWLAMNPAPEVAQRSPW